MRRMMQNLATLVWVSGFLFATDPPPGVWLDIPFVMQKKDGCGAASVAMVMEYWQAQQGGSVPANAAQIERDLPPDGSHGIYASDMQRYFEKKGYATFAFRGEWSDLEEHLQKGRPLIVALKPGSMGSLHYVVVAGFDQERQLVLVNDPAQRKLLKEDRSRFEQGWKGAGRWTLLALPGTGAH
jgi:predicted double-glycine peptidase